MTTEREMLAHAVTALAEALQGAGENISTSLDRLATAVGSAAGAPCLACQGRGRVAGNDLCEACEGTGWKRPKSENSERETD